MNRFNFLPSARYIITLLVLFVLVACGGGGSSGGSVTPVTTPINLWTWMSGSNVTNQSGVYGTKGTANAANVPGARTGSVSWTDSSDNLWLFGGHDCDTVQSCELNDLWKYDGSNWTWMSGSDVVNQQGTYGTQGTAADINVPGARQNAISWIDSSGNRWMFGGIGYDSIGTRGYLNDLWKYDGMNWTWVSGSDASNHLGVYGIKGTAAGTNMPGGRAYAVSWIDSSDNLWLLGGYGYASGAAKWYLSDLWKFDGTSWTWMSGNSAASYTSGVYSTKGTAADTNMPGSRKSAISWTDSSDNLWLFGGWGYDSTGSSVELNDLWKYDGTNWTWVSGSDLGDQAGVYAGTTAADNVPGGRDSSIRWSDSGGNLWLYGGYGYDSGVTVGFLNDLWRYDGSQWIWVSGRDIFNASGTYGTQGATDAANAPGGRGGAVSWTDSGGHLWLFGGYGQDSVGTPGQLNDLWRYQP